MSVIFAPNIFEWLFGSGIGTNIGAALVWVPIGALLGFVWAKTKYWPLHAIHEKIDELQESHGRLHDSHGELHRKLDQLLLMGVPETDVDEDDSNAHHTPIPSSQKAVGKPREKQHDEAQES